MELDELLADLQSALPPEQQVTSPPEDAPAGSSAMGHSNGGPPFNGHTSPPHDHLYDHTEHPGLNTQAERASIASTAIVVRYTDDREESTHSPFDDEQYSVVRKGPFYSPHLSTSESPQPYDTMAGPSTTSPPPAKPPRDATKPSRESFGASAGLSELDNLLAMLNDTQQTIQEDSDSKGQPVPRPSVGALVDELTEVEQQIRGGRTESISNNEGGAGEAASGAGGGGKRNITASTATLELDELMQNLSKFEAANQAQGGDGARKDGSQKGKSAMDDLSSMLTSLDQDMTTRHGVNTVAKGMCAACNKPILNKVVKALGKQWHPEHFTCACCDAELGSTTYYESNGRPYCEKDYNELYAPRCAYCNGPILDRVMRALDRTWHPEHFFCTLCGKHFGTEGFHQKDGKAFCRECYYEKFAPRCRRCDKAIMEGFITAINAQWHPECFSCKVCGVTFPRGNYFEHEGEPHCEIHYHASRGTLCNSCQKPVTGKCITAMGKKWHPEHFNCAFCLKLLNKGTFKEHRQNPYCHPCYIKLFG